MQISLNIVYKILIFFGLTILLQPGLKVTAQVLTQGPGGDPVSVHFVKPDIHQKAGDLSFNIARIINNSDTAIRVKPISVFPDGWPQFSLAYRDTLINPHDSISLLYRFQIPEQVNSEVDHEIFFRVYSMQNNLLSECRFFVYPEEVHKWDIVLPDNRKFFYPRNKQADIDLLVENNGNTTEAINLQILTDNKSQFVQPGRLGKRPAYFPGAFHRYYPEIQCQIHLPGEPGLRHLQTADTSFLR